MVLFAALVAKAQKSGKKPAKAIKQAVKLFREERSETNAAAVRQYVHDRQRPPSPTGESETDSSRPKLKFESFHFCHCYDILRSSPQFLEALLEQCRANVDGCKRRRKVSEEEYSSSTSDSDTADSQEDEMLHNPFQAAKVGAISSAQMRWQTQERVPQAKPVLQPHEEQSVIITFEESEDVDVPRLECDRAVANDYVRLRTRTLQEDRRLKLLAELRGVVTTIAQLAQQLAWNGVASAALAARTGAVCPALDEDVLRDIAFFRHEKQRLKQAIAALDCA
ncbi:hypothetical protein PHMEG_0007304 [Phytophthora megakarya]|uniref:Uncharacterized protein n=1 Tax=Phytophthora megakarya TaxID=4795 RepID=A0A225WLM4_9STRA|nr:hypothetical protein PHMEG_0007304 [Phytophthora megakarya]